MLQENEKEQQRKKEMEREQQENEAKKQREWERDQLAKEEQRQKDWEQEQQKKETELARSIKKELEEELGIESDFDESDHGDMSEIQSEPQIDDDIGSLMDSNDHIDVSPGQPGHMGGVSAGNIGALKDNGDYRDVSLEHKIDNKITEDGNVLGQPGLLKGQGGVVGDPVYQEKVVDDFEDEESSQWDSSHDGESENVQNIKESGGGSQVSSMDNDGRARRCSTGMSEVMSEDPEGDVGESGDSFGSEVTYDDQGGQISKLEDADHEAVLKNNNNIIDESLKQAPLNEECTSTAESEPSPIKDHASSPKEINGITQTKQMISPREITRMTKDDERTTPRELNRLIRDDQSGSPEEITGITDGNVRTAKDANQLRKEEDDLLEAYKVRQEEILEAERRMEEELLQKERERLSELRVQFEQRQEEERRKMVELERQRKERDLAMQREREEYENEMKRKQTERKRAEEERKRKDLERLEELKRLEDNRRYCLTVQVLRMKRSRQFTCVNRC